MPPEYGQGSKKEKSPIAIIIVAVAVFAIMIGVGLYFFLWHDPGNESGEPDPTETGQESPQNGNDTSGDNNRDSDNDRENDGNTDDGDDAVSGGERAVENDINGIVIAHEGTSITELELEMYERASLQAIIDPPESDTELDWENTDPSALAVSTDEAGIEALIRGVGPGKTVITVTAGSVEQRIEVSVNKTDIERREFIIPDSSRRSLSESDVRHLSNAELVIAWNEIFARHGFMFGSKSLIGWFESQPWYVPVHPLGTFNYGLLSRTESRNVNMLRELRDKRNDGLASYQGTGAHDLYFYQTFWDSGNRYIHVDETEEMYIDLEIALFEIYARNGRIFDNLRWSEYFKSFTWYEPYIPDNLFDDSLLNSFEQANVEMLRHQISLNPNLETNED